VALTIKSYLMYDHIPASLYRRTPAETDGKKYRLRITEGEVSASQPFVHVETNRHSRLYREKGEAMKAAEMLFRTFESVGWHVYSPALPSHVPPDAQYRRHFLKYRTGTRNYARGPSCPGCGHIVQQVQPDEKSDSRSLPIVKHEPMLFLMRILVEMIDATGVQGRTTF
jgi:hypothetical protein